MYYALLLGTIALAATAYFYRETLMVAAIRRLAEPKAIAKPAGITVTRDLCFARRGQTELMLDLYAPEGHTGKPLPLVVVFHGGGWFVGNRHQTVSKPMQVQRLVHAGYAVATVSYRLSTVAPFPAQLHDARAAVQWLAAHSDQLQLDSDRIAVWGFSAGGHLAAMLASNNTDLFRESSDEGSAFTVRAAVNFFGPADLPSWRASSGRTGIASATWMLNTLFQHSGTVPESQLEAASPVRAVNANSAPMLLVHGSEDPVVPVSQSEALLRAYQQRQLPARLHIEQGAGHGTGAYFKSQDMIDLVAQFLDATLMPKTTATADAAALSQP